MIAVRTTNSRQIHSELLKQHAEKIIAIHMQNESRNIEAIINMGRELSAVRQILVDNREWGSWVRDNLPVSRRSALQYYWVFCAFGGGEIRSLVEKFSSVACYALSVPSCPSSAFAEAIEVAKTGQRVSARMAYELVAKYSSEDRKPALIKRAKRHNNRLKDCKQKLAFDIDKAFETMQNILREIRENHPRDKLRPVARLLHELVSREIESLDRKAVC